MVGDEIEKCAFAISGFFYKNTLCVLMKSPIHLTVIFPTPLLK